MNKIYNETKKDLPPEQPAMIKLLLNGEWTLTNETDGQTCKAVVPATVYAALIKEGLIADPYVKDNEKTALKISDNDFTFSRDFYADAGLLRSEKIMLVCDGLDTLAEIFINGSLIASVKNMHTGYRFDVKKYVNPGKNEIRIHFFSPTKYIEKMYSIHQPPDFPCCMKGFSFIRKAHCAFGWDWGPALPDMGIFRDIFICGYSGAVISDVFVRQRTTSEFAEIDVNIAIDNARGKGIKTVAELSLKGAVVKNQTVSVTDTGVISFSVPNPKLWWPNGQGEQTLYDLSVKIADETGFDERKLKIGLRSLTIRREKDEYGESFCVNINGRDIFGMGANMIPADTIVPHITRGRVGKMLDACADANFNTVRVWGGAYYPDNYFYELCDERGLLVWQDCMFACGTYVHTEEFERLVTEELVYNMKRIRNHASLLLICGNNEVEEFLANPNGELRFKADYAILFDYIIPKIIKEYAPDTFFWPSSPSSGGKFVDTAASDKGDKHYWDVWHGQAPFSDYKKHLHRFCSEFGFQSYPSLKTLKPYVDKNDLNMYSYMMEHRQKHFAANSFIGNYISKTYRMPSGFENTVYLSQVMQAAAIRFGVEHFRRNRGRCMGAVYWQLNDIWPGISWSSVDYFGRYKLLHYSAKRFFAPVLLSYDIEDKKCKFFICNESPEEFNGKARIRFFTPDGKIVGEESFTVYTPALSSAVIAEIDAKELLDKYGERRLAVAYDLFDGGGVSLSRESALFCNPKHFEFLPAKIKYSVKKRGIDMLLTLTAGNFVQGVDIDWDDKDYKLSVNNFDMLPGEKYNVIVYGGGDGDIEPGLKIRYLSMDLE